MFRLLAQKSASVETIFDGQTLLIYALSQRKSPEIIDYLIQNSRNINAQNSNCETALLLAVDRGTPEQVRLLLDKGADLDIQDKDLRSPLSLAVQKDQVELVQTLLQKGARVGGRNKLGQNLMHSARSVRMAEILSNSSVVVDEPDAQGETPLSQAVRHGQLDLVRFFTSKGKTAFSQ